MLELSFISRAAAGAAPVRRRSGWAFSSNVAKVFVFGVGMFVLAAASLPWMGGCDSGCVRHTDCLQGEECFFGTCQMPPAVDAGLDADTSSLDADVSDSDDLDATVGDADFDDSDGDTADLDGDTDDLDGDIDDLDGDADDLDGDADDLDGDADDLDGDLGDADDSDDGG